MNISRNRSSATPSPEMTSSKIGRPVEDGALLLLGELVTELLQLAGEPFVPADPVDGLVPRGGHEPGTRVGRNA
jgi:hypothetical protein